MIIVLSILKIAGILLLILACVLALILFMPVVYEVNADLDRRQFRAEIHWLFRLLRFHFSFQKKAKAVLSVLWFSVDFTDSQRKRKREQKKAKKNARKYAKRKRKALRKRRKNGGGSGERADLQESAGAAVQSDSAVQTDSTVQTDSAVQSDGTVYTEPHRDRKTEEEEKSRSAGKISAGAKKAAAMISLARQYDLAGSAGPPLLAFLRQIRPRVLKGRVLYGLEDPANTGYITGALAAIPFLYEFDLVLVPDFETDENEISGTVFVKGHLLLIHAVVLVIRLLRQKNIRAFIGAWKKAGGL